MTAHIETLIIGGGQAGLALNSYLTQQGRTHLVLEQGRVGETWRSARWDSFTLNTPNWMAQLPGFPHQVNDPDGFPGLYFLGLNWLYKRKSALLYGVGEDAAFIASAIAERR